LNNLGKLLVSLNYDETHGAILDKIRKIPSFKAVLIAKLEILKDKSLHQNIYSPSDSFWDLNSSSSYNPEIKFTEVNNINYIKNNKNT